MKGLRVTMVIAVCVGLFACSCQNPVAEARRALARELAARRANRERSMKLYRRGLEALEASQLDRAGSCLTDAIGADDRNAHAWMALGVVRFRQDRLFQAASAFDRAARLEPTRHEPHFNIGTVLESAGHHAQAVEAYNTALKLAPNQLEVMENLARCYIHTGTQPQRARELIERCLQTERRPEWRAWLQDQAVRLRPGREQSP